MPNAVVSLGARALGFDGHFKCPCAPAGPAVGKALWSLPGAVLTYIFTPPPCFFFKLYINFSF